MSSVVGLVELLEKVNLNNTISECVLIVKNNVCTCKAVDLTNVVFVQASTPLEIEDCVLAFGNISLLYKYLKSYQNLDIVITKDDNRLRFKPKGGSVLKFLLAQPDLIPTYEESWETEDRVGSLLAAITESIPLTMEAISEFNNHFRTFATKNVALNVAKNGAVSIVGGNENEHQFIVPFGKSKFTPCSLLINGTVLSAILSVVDVNKEPLLYISEGNPVVITNSDVTWIMNTNDEQQTP